MAWTSEQQRAIDTRGKGLIVSAAAGSGKTSVLIERLKNLLKEKDAVPADKMIVVTFTNDAANEMKIRLNDALEQELQKNPDNDWLMQQQALLGNAHISTISSFCFDLIRENVSDLGITAGFRILEPSEALILNQAAADTVLNRWHKEHKEEMQFLWDCFCEKDDQPLEEILLSFHNFLASVPDKTIWEQKVYASYEKNVKESPYYEFLQDYLKGLMESAKRLCEKGMNHSQDIIADSKNNKILQWFNKEMATLESISKELDTDSAELRKHLESTSHDRFPTINNKLEPDPYALELAKSVKENFVAARGKMEEALLCYLGYEEQDFAICKKINPLLFQLEEEFAEELWNRKVEQDCLSFEDAERLALQLLSHVENGQLQQSKLAKDMSEFYKVIMIDEYQDTNQKQDTIFKLLSHNCINPDTGKLRYGDDIFIVGDVKQSIYRFRLANPNIFNDAIKSTQEPGSLCEHIPLNKNFRSTEEVLNFVNYLCGSIMRPSCGGVEYNMEEALIPGSAVNDCEQLGEQDKGIKVGILKKTEENPNPKITYVIHTIQKMIQDGVKVYQKDGVVRPCQYSDFCILNFSKQKNQNYAKALKEAGIPCHQPEETGYLKSREISLLLNMLRAVDNPLKDTPLAAIMLSPMFHFTTDDLVVLRHGNTQNSLYKNVLDYKEDNEIQAKCQKLLTNLQQIRQKAVVSSLEDLIRYIYEVTDFSNIVEILPQGQQMRANLELLIQHGKSYEANTDITVSGVSGFLRYVDKLQKTDGDFNCATQLVENAVEIKTMHASKGLEFPFVILGSLEHKFNTQDSNNLALFQDSGLAGYIVKNPETYESVHTYPHLMLNKQQQNEDVGEQLRLLYVALTRAKQMLILPLASEDIVTKKNNCIQEWYHTIPITAFLPDKMVLQIDKMEKWIWLVLILKNDTAFNVLNGQNVICRWEAPEWYYGVTITYEADKEPEASDSPIPVQQVVGQADEQMVQELIQLQNFQYHTEEENLETLISVSALKRQDEIEQQNFHTPWQRPAFTRQKRLTGAERGTAIHTFLQYADFAQAERSVSEELNRLQTMGYLTQEQVEVIPEDVVMTFLQSDLYKRMKQAKKIERERKFLIRCGDLDISADISPLLMPYKNSDTMIKGIIDLAILEEQGYVLVDYKTDALLPDQLVEEYRDQILIYQKALECISGLPVREAYLYSTKFGKLIPVT